MGTGINVKSILVKTPFRRVSPEGRFYFQQVPVDGSYSGADNDELLYTIVSQAEFMREYEVTGHKINSPSYYPDKEKKDPDTGMVLTEKVFRASFPFQYVILIKQLVHLCGNTIEFKDSTLTQTDTSKNKLTMFRQGWIDKNMDVAFFLSAKSEKSTGDCALCQYIHEGKQGYRVFSYADGDKLYPHYDTITGKLNLFARKYSQFDEEGKELSEYVEVWDKSHLYRFIQEKSGVKGAINKTLALFGLDGYKEISRERHGFPSIPISYKRSKIGACWTPVQEGIDAYELSVSQLCESNKVYAFPIMFLKGGDLDIQAKMDGRPFAISSADPEADVKMVGQSSASESFKLQLDTILKNIFMGSFTVVPPEVRSGDLPGVAIKLIYSPAVEKAMEDANEWNQFIDDTVRIFKFAYGIEKKQTSDFNTMDINGTIVPYVHQNVAEITTNLCQQVLAGVKSVETASGQVPDGASDEYHRLLKQERDAIINEARISNNNQAQEAVAQ